MDGRGGSRGFFLFLLLGLGTGWTTADAIWAEMPVLVRLFPQGLSLPAQLSAVAQSASALTLVCTWLCRSALRRRTVKLAVVRVALSAQLGACAALAAAWHLPLRKGRLALIVFACAAVGNVIGSLNTLVVLPFVAACGAQPSSVVAVNIGVQLSSMLAGLLGMSQVHREWLSRSAYFGVFIVVAAVATAAGRRVLRDPTYLAATPPPPSGCKNAAVRDEPVAQDDPDGENDPAPPRQEAAPSFRAGDDGAGEQKVAAVSAAVLVAAEEDSAVTDQPPPAEAASPSSELTARVWASVVPVDMATWGLAPALLPFAASAVAQSCDAHNATTASVLRWAICASLVALPLGALPDARARDARSDRLRRDLPLFALGGLLNFLYLALMAAGALDSQIRRTASAVVPWGLFVIVMSAALLRAGDTMVVTKAFRLIAGEHPAHRQRDADTLGAVLALGNVVSAWLGFVPVRLHLLRCDAPVNSFP